MPGMQEAPLSGWRLRLLHVRRRWQLYVLLALPVAYIIAFAYVPMLGAQIAHITGDANIDAGWDGYLATLDSQGLPRTQQAYNQAVGA